MLSLIERDPTSVFFSFENISGASNVAHHALQENFVHSPKNTNQNQTNPAYVILKKKQNFMGKRVRR